MDFLDDQFSSVELVPGAFLFNRFASNYEKKLLEALCNITSQAPPRRMQTPGGYQMSVAMTSCGDAGWVSDHLGYRYEKIDPISKTPWPKMPQVFKALSISAATKAGYVNYNPDTCLINVYEPGAKMSLHQDKNEDLNQPIVSLSLGLSATFQLGGPNKTDPIQKISLHHTDVLVFGGPSRLSYHGILPLKKGEHFLLGLRRINLTFRKI